MANGNIGASGKGSFSVGINTLASGEASHAEGRKTVASAWYSHAEGYETKASGDSSHAEGYKTLALVNNTHAEGYETTASGSTSHAEGYRVIAHGSISHAEGYKTTSSGEYSHAEGYKTTSSGKASHAAGYMTTAQNEAQSTFGKFNTATATDTLIEVGNGTSSSKSNALEVYLDGRVYAPSLQSNNITDPKCLVTKEYVDANAGGSSGSSDNFTVVNDLPTASLSYFQKIVYVINDGNIYYGVSNTPTPSSDSDVFWIQK